MQISLLLTVGLAAAAALGAQIPAGYYATVDPTNAMTLRATLHAVIDDHVEFPYSASSTDTWDVLEDAQQDPSNSSRVLGLYRNASFQKRGGGNSLYNREHVWPRSLGFPDGDPFGPFTDCHHLWLCDDGYNTARSNKPYGPCTSSHTEYVTNVNNGTGGGAGAFPGNSNWTSGSFGSGTWQVWGGRKGDVARSLLYMDIRYEGGVHGGTGNSESDLILTDDRALIQSRNTGQNEPVAYMGLLTELLQWHLDDPPDATERRRNDVVYSYQQNRNPFVDHPEWVAIVYGLATPGTVASYGAGCRVGAPTAPVISVPIPPTTGALLTISMFVAPPSAPAAMHLGTSATSIDLGVIGFSGCSLFTVPEIALPSMSSLFGTASVNIPIPADNNLVGVHLFGQWIAVDAAASSIAVTGGVDMTIGG